MNDQGVGQSAARKMARFYLLLTEADFSKGKEVKINDSVNTTHKTKSRTGRVNKSNIKNKEIKSSTSDNKIMGNSLPDININIQIHISADTSSDQIEKIFESMSKHLSKFQS